MESAAVNPPAAAPPTQAAPRRLRVGDWAPISILAAATVALFVTVIGLAESIGELRGGQNAIADGQALIRADIAGLRDGQAQIQADIAEIRAILANR